MTRWLNGLDRFGIWAAVVFFILIVLLMFAEVISRYIFGFSISGIEEMALLSMLFGVFLAVGAILRIDAHVRMSLVMDKFNGRTKTAVRLTGDLVTLAVAVVFLVSSILFISSQYASGAVSISLQMPMWIYFLGVPIGALLLVIHAAEVTVRDLLNLRKPGVLEPVSVTGQGHS